MKTARYSPTPQAHVRSLIAERVVLRVAISDVRKKAFFSGTDDRDDNGNCTISGVVGKLSSTCEMVFRFNLPKNMKINDLKVADIFAEEGQNFEVPAEWLSQVKREAPKTYGNYATGGRQYGYQGGNTGVGKGNNVVSNPNFQGNRSAGMALDATDQEVLAAFGYPFALEEEGDRPFSHSLPGRGHKKQRKNTRLKTKTRS